MPTVHLPQGQRLTVVSTSPATGRVQRLPDTPGGAPAGGSTAVAVGATQTFGPYSTGAWFDVISERGELAYSVGNATPSVLEADQIRSGVMTFSAGPKTTVG